jgi:hypothetical protein
MQARKRARPAATSGGDGGSGAGTSSMLRRKSTPVSVATWAAAHEHASLPLVPPYARDKLALQRKGTLRPELPFRCLPGWKGMPLLLPVGYRTTREYDDWHAPAGAMCTYVQEIRAAAHAHAPTFAVWPEGNDEHAALLQGSSPWEVWRLVAARVASERAKLPPLPPPHAPAAPAPGAVAAGAHGDALDDPIIVLGSDDDADTDGAAATGSAPAAGAGDVAPVAAMASARVISEQMGVAYFGLSCKHIVALLELLPGLETCTQAPNAYVTLLHTAEAAAAPVAASAFAAHAPAAAFAAPLLNAQPPSAAPAAPPSAAPAGPPVDAPPAVAAPWTAAWTALRTMMQR